MTGKEMLKLYQSKGWRIDRIKGSHRVMKKGGKTQVIPIHGKDLPRGLEKSLIKRLEE